MRLVVLASVRIGGDQRAVLELHGWSKAAPLKTRTGLRIQREAIPGTIERKARVGLLAGQSPYPKRWLEITHGERQQQALVLQPQNRHVHLPIIVEVAARGDTVCAGAGGSACDAL